MSGVMYRNVFFASASVVCVLVLAHGLLGSDASTTANAVDAKVESVSRGARQDSAERNSAALPTSADLGRRLPARRVFAASADETSVDPGGAEAELLEQELMQEEREQMQVRYRALSRRLQAEKVDPSWAQSTNQRIDDAIAAIKTHSGEPNVLTKVDCRETICYLDVSHPSELARIQFMTSLQVQGVSGGTIRKLADGRSEGYLSRVGTHLPKYEDLNEDEKAE